MIKLFLLPIFLLQMGLVQANPILSFVQKKHPLCQIKAQPFFFTKKELAHLQKVSQIDIQSRMGRRYLVYCDKKPAIYAYIDSRIVRTLNQTLLIEIAQNISQIDIFDFMEPPEYRPPTKWLQKAIGQNKKIRLDALSGATMTTQATNASINKIITIHQYLSKNANKL